VIDDRLACQPPRGPVAAFAVVGTLPAAAALAVARQRVEQHRAAGVNQLSGVRSTYRWQGRVEDAGEARLLVETTSAGRPAARSPGPRRHPSAMPQILALPVVAGDEPDLEWLKRSVMPA
jgi:periplasmic divalent cation tolerance protein